MRARTLLGLLLAMIVGCSRGPSDRSAPSDTAAAGHSALGSPSLPTSRQPPAATDLAPPVGCPFEDDRDVWDVYRLQGNKVGYAHTRIDRVQAEGRTLVRLRWYSRLLMKRSGQTTETQTRLTSRETPDGRLVDFESIQMLGTVPIRTRGRVEGDRLIVETTTQGQPRTIELPWLESDGGFHAVGFSLVAEPMKPGETRSLRALMPDLNQVVTMRLAARRFEPTQLLHGTYRLLRIDTRTWFGDTPAFDATVWVDQKGEVLKARMAAMEQEIFRCSREEALDETDLGKFDIMLHSMVPIHRKISNPHDTRRIRYRVSLAEGDPAATLVSGTSQQVKSLSDGSAELTVVAVRPDWPKETKTSRADRPTSDDLLPNSLVQSDDERVVAMAEEAIRGKADAWSKAVALERDVHETVRDTTFSHALASAAEVARTGEGDCTEHAVLLAAMARAVGLPARVAIGLVYGEQEQEPKHAFNYHMWTEIYVDDRWIPLDATLGRGGIGAAHVKLAHSSLKDTGAMGSFLPVVNVMGQMKLEVLEIQ